MSEIKTKHRGGFTATKPGLAPGGHPEQKPGAAAGGSHMGKMGWGHKSGK